MTRSIAELPELLEALDAEARARFDTLFRVTTTTGGVETPPEMRDWVSERFGSLEAVATQRIVKVLNRWTYEGACFNELRARRPIPRAARAGGEVASGDCDFCEPLTRTTADPFGRIEGARSITAANVAKADAMHGLVIFDVHDPYGWDEEAVVDAFATARRWLAAANDHHPAARYPLVIWNTDARAGASVAHPHLQMLLAEEVAYGRIEAWRNAIATYGLQTGRSFTDDLVDTHAALGLAGGTDVRWLAHLTPVKERELVLIGRALDDALAGAIHAALMTYRDVLGARAFNVACWLRPVSPVQEDWSGFPAIVRIVDRGDPARATSDIGAMELYAQPVIAADPFTVADAARAALT